MKIPPPPFLHLSSIFFPPSQTPDQSREPLGLESCPPFTPSAFDHLQSDQSRQRLCESHPFASCGFDYLLDSRTSPVEPYFAPICLLTDHSAVGRV